MRNKKVLIIGAGGREHALARQFAKSLHISEVWVAPGNPGMIQSESQTHAPINCLDLAEDDFEALAVWVVTEGVSLTFVGPEVPLNLGIVNYFDERGLAIVGPTKEAAQLEASKTFAKDMMKKAGVRTAAHQTFSPEEFAAAQDYLSKQNLPIVLKQDGLAQGKGVVISLTMEDAHANLNQMMNEYRSNVVIEECLVGEEFSHFSLVNGCHIIPIGTARDYKRAYDQDLGPNTGGMGAYAGVKWVNQTLNDTIIRDIIQPLSDQMVADGVPFTGVLYTGLMLTEQGLQVIEFNTRFGDPETQILLPLLETDFYEIVMAHLQQETIQIKMSINQSLGVVLAAEGYPKSFNQGMSIELAPEFPHDQIYYAGVKTNSNGDKLITTGGRILMVTAQAESINQCRDIVYGLIQQIKLSHSFYRTDIGL